MIDTWLPNNVKIVQKQANWNTSTETVSSHKTCIEWCWNEINQGV